jgi:hypothetical protein
MGRGPISHPPGCVVPLAQYSDCLNRRLHRLNDYTDYYTKNNQRSVKNLCNPKISEICGSDYSQFLILSLRLLRFNSQLYKLMEILMENTGCPKIVMHKPVFMCYNLM